MKSGNLRKLYIIYWRHPDVDWENARTTEFYKLLIYDEVINLKFREDLDFRFLNCHRRSADYLANHEIIEYYRVHKVRREPLVYMELWKNNSDGRKEEFISIDSDYRMNLALQRILFHLETKW